MNKKLLLILLFSSAVKMHGDNTMLLEGQLGASNGYTFNGPVKINADAIAVNQPTNIGNITSPTTISGKLVVTGPMITLGDKQLTALKLYGQNITIGDSTSVVAINAKDALTVSSSGDITLNSKNALINSKNATFKADNLMQFTGKTASFESAAINMTGVAFIMSGTKLDMNYSSVNICSEGNILSTAIPGAVNIGNGTSILPKIVTIGKGPKDVVMIGNSNKTLAPSAGFWVYTPANFVNSVYCHAPLLINNDNADNFNIVLGNTTNGGNITLATSGTNALVLKGRLDVNTNFDAPITLGSVNNASDITLSTGGNFVVNSNNTTINASESFTLNGKSIFYGDIELNGDASIQNLVCDNMIEVRQDLTLTNLGTAVNENQFLTLDNTGKVVLRDLPTGDNNIQAPLVTINTTLPNAETKIGNAAGGNINLASQNDIILDSDVEIEGMLNVKKAVVFENYIPTGDAVYLVADANGLLSLASASSENNPAYIDGADVLINTKTYGGNTTIGNNVDSGNITMNVPSNQTITLRGPIVMNSYLPSNITPDSKGVYIGVGDENNHELVYIGTSTSSIQGDVVKIGSNSNVTKGSNVYINGNVTVNNEEDSLGSFTVGRANQVTGNAGGNINLCTSLNNQINIGNLQGGNIIIATAKDNVNNNKEIQLISKTIEIVGSLYVNTVNVGNNNDVVIGNKLNTGNITIATGGTINMQGTTEINTGAAFNTTLGNNTGSLTFQSNSINLSSAIQPLYVDRNGNLTTTASSAAIKTDIQDFKVDMDKFRELRPCQYKYVNEAGKTNKHNNYGFIAEEVQEIFPSAVFTSEEGKAHNIDEKAFLAILVNVIIDMQDEMKTLENKNKTLKEELHNVYLRLSNQENILN